MTEVVEQAKEVIQRRLHEIAEEIGRLERAVGHLARRSDGGRPDGRPRQRRSPARRKAAPPAPRGQRAAQIAELVEKRPGIKGVEIAKELGIAPSQVYAVAGRLEKQGKIKKKNRGYEVKTRRRAAARAKS